MDIYNIIEDVNLNMGDTKRMNCPSCNGYKTFSITNNNGKIVWNCFKASCNLKGAKSIHLTTDDIRKYMQSRIQKEKKFVLPEYVVPIKKNNFCLKYYGIHSCDVLYDVKENRVVFPIKHDGEIVDAVGKAEKRLPKWKRYGNSSVPYVKGKGSVAVVVEDCISAYVVANYGYVGIALLGTSLSDKHKEFLLHYKKVIVALDPDALKKNLQIARELRNWVAEVKVLRLTDDLKYRRTIDIDNLKELVWN